ncbi:hypothetical protein D3C72_865500 [compost metagenome]
MRAFLFVAFLGWSLQSLASSVYVRPSVSEGLFPCNAGIVHAGTEIKGNDFIEVQYEDLTVAESHPARFRADTLASNSSVTDYQLIFSSTDIWNRKITSLAFNFSTEKTGAAYFVDFCYLGPIEDLKGNGNGNGNGNKKDASEGIYTLDSSLTANNLTSEVSYRTQVGLQAKLEFICDLRKRGNAQSARSSSALAPTGTMEADSAFYDNFSPISSTGLAFEKDLNSTTPTVPRFCRLRASFLESTITDRSNGATNAEMTVYLNIQKN